MWTASRPAVTEEDSGLDDGDVEGCQHKQRLSWLHQISPQQEAMGVNPGVMGLKGKASRAEDLQSGCVPAA